MEFTFFGFHIKSVFAEPSEDLSDMLFVRSHVLGEDKDVIQIDYNANIEEICKDGVETRTSLCLYSTSFTYLSPDCLTVIHSLRSPF